MLSAAWDWLEDNGYPRDVTDLSRYWFITQNAAPIAVAEVRQMEDCLWLQILFVAGPYRRHGVGNALLYHIESYAAHKGTTVRMGTNSSNAAMLGLAKTRGFAGGDVVYLTSGKHDLKEN